ncbi:hypothetical protein EWF20_07900 [Sulfolobus sp. S-194]|uniref:hypothetical protein n=1 Tax=Sulfolobus sp. S-194 TaxID=2512240 RepID=UPI001436F433|nr:hypothetical protein [Sulfolobus sp. S-194]QIW24073.1 hypothetical protein EWF20_07900 [Sulfolobus sp. S-194]
MHIHISPIIAEVIFFIISWVIISIPVWLASKLISRHSSFPRAMLAVLAGIIVFAIITAIFSALAVGLGIHLLFPLGILFGFIGILGIYKAVFETGWLGALGIAILSIIITIIIAFILELLGITIVSLHGIIP